MRKLFAVMFMVFIVSALEAQERNFWTAVNESLLNKNLFASRQKPSAYQLFQLNEVALKSSMSVAPSEKNVAAAASSFILSIPDAEGRLEKFSVVEAPVMDPALAARYPGINSYIGKGVNNASAIIRFDVSPQGFHGMILYTGKPTVYIDPVDEATRTYIVVSRKDVVDYRAAFQCLTEATPDARTSGNEGAALRNADDGRLRTFRLALCASGEFSQYWLNGTEANDAERKAKVLAAQNTEMTRANGIFERDFGLRLVLVANNDAVIYLNASTDPWSSNLNGVTQTTCDNVIGSANYDIGHLVHRAADNGNAGCIACVCKNGSKGSGFTSYLNLASDYFVVDYLTHEMGHQLGANHTFTFSNEGTVAQVEPGSGSTIMGYAGITGATTDVQPHSDDYFHAISIEQVTNYIKSPTGGGACAVVTLTGDATPTAAAGADYVIPKSTPFTLTGSGSDADAGDVLTFCWEQMNARGTGSSTVPSATATSGPQFRSYLPGSSTSRTIPQLSSILSGTNSNKWEVLPSVARTLNFRFTVKDNHAGGGNNRSDDMIVTVSSTTGPFAVTAPNTAVTWGAGSSQTVTWSVNGTNGSPVNCATVNILLSTDGGQTFPTVLAAGTANDGSQLITVPNDQSNTCRIKVEAAGNIFFDISNANFTIGAVAPCADPTGLASSSITSSSATVSWAAVSGANNYDVQYKASSSGTWLDAAVGTAATSVNIGSLAASTSYDWRVRANCTSASSNYSQSSFTTTAGGGGGCPGAFDVSTNGTTGGAAEIPLNTNVLGSINVRNDNDYYSFVITTGGTITLTLSTLPDNYQLALLSSSGTQLALSQNNGTATETINTTVAAGSYYARVFPKANASSSSCYTLRVQAGTASRGGNGAEGLYTLSIYPNPAKSTLNVNLSSLEGVSDVQLFDVQGRIVMQKRVSAMNAQLNVESLPSGVYMVKVRNNNTDVLTSKFVKE